MPDRDDLLARIDRLSARTDGACVEPRDIAEMNDVLSEGFARALADEARLDQLEQRLAELLSGVASGRARELRHITVEWRATERDVSRLRSRLAVMHERFIALATGARQD
jgi:hypothetical protein